jgi:DNA-binding transcriptional ArsR family regulator
VAIIISREARESALLFKYLGDPVRLTILGLLAAEGEMYVGQLCERLKMSNPAISSPLRLLRASGLVATHRNGARVIYSLTYDLDDMADRVKSALDSVRQVSPNAGKAKRRTG